MTSRPVDIHDAANAQTESDNTLPLSDSIVIAVIAILTIASVWISMLAGPIVLPDVIVIGASASAIAGMMLHRGVLMWIALGGWTGLAVTGLTSFGFFPLLLTVLLLGWIIRLSYRSGEPSIRERWLVAQVLTFASVVTSIIVLY